MKKMVTTIAVIILLSPILAWSNIRAIRFITIPDIEQFEQENLYIFNHLYLLEEWVAEWKFEQTREDVRSKVEKLFNSLAEIESKNATNIDIVLYRGVLAHYLYNLDATEYHEKAVQQFDRAISIDPKDYRGKWFKGVHLTKALLQPEESFALLEDVATGISWDHISPYFWADYAEVSYITGMPCHAIMGVKYANRLLSTEDRQAYWKYSNLQWILESLSKETEIDKTIKKDDLWHSVSLNNKQGYRSYSLGILFFVKQDWQYQFTDYSNEATGIVIKPKEYQGPGGNSVSSSIGVIFNARQDFDPEAFVSRIAPKGAIPKKTLLPIEIKESISYEILTNEIYPQLGGAHFVITIVKRPYPEIPGIALETPLKWDFDNDGQPKYLRQTQVYMRINRPIYYIFILDIGVSFYEEAFKDYINFINKMVILE